MNKTFCQCPNLECGDVSPLSDWATYRPVPKRGLVRALQIKALPAFLKKWGAQSSGTGILPVRWSASRGLFQKPTGRMPVPLTNFHISILKKNNKGVTWTMPRASLFWRLN
jgi:hypothetical protein